MKVRLFSVPAHDVSCEEIGTGRKRFPQNMNAVGFHVLTICLSVAMLLASGYPSRAVGDDTTARRKEPSSSYNQSATPGKVLLKTKPEQTTDARRRVHRAIVLGRIGKPSDIPCLVQWLNDTRRVRVGNSVKVAGINTVAQRSLHRVVKRTIIKDPSNIRVLTPLLHAAADGTPDQRRAAVEILGALKEPLAEPLLARLATDPQDPFREIAATGLNRIRSDSVFSPESLRMKYFQIFLLAACVILGIGIFVAIVRDLRAGDTPRVLLLALCLVITLWFGGIIGSDYLMTTVKDTSIDEAIRKGNLVTLAKKITFDLSDYPADSYVARYLVSKRDPSIVPILARVKKEIPSSTLYQKYWNTSLQQRADWIIARIKASVESKAGMESYRSNRQVPDTTLEEILSVFPIPSV
jgi:hypothetical protein